MNLEKYKKIVDRNSKKEKSIKNIIISFISGGIIGLIGQLFTMFLNKNYDISLSECYMYLMIVLVFISSLLTGLGVFDKATEKLKAGLLVPTTGFAHSMSASAMDHHGEGLVNSVGSNIFKMTGSIILYGIISGVFFALIKAVIG